LRHDQLSHGRHRETDVQRDGEGKARGPSRRGFITGAAALGLGAPALAGQAPALASRPWFEVYLSAFNRADEAAYGAYYADDVQFFGQAAQVTGRTAVLDFYRRVRTYLHERVELLTFVGDPDGAHILAEIRTTLVAHRDWPDMPTGPMMTGERRESVNFAMYDIAGGRFVRIRSARFGRRATVS
jgi:hypothetical protein